MHELHLRYLEARRVRGAEPLGAAEVALRARELARLHVRVRAGPRVPRDRLELGSVGPGTRGPARPASREVE
jgi:hypothetical protein